MNTEETVNPKPAFASHNIPIVLSCSEYYSLYAAVFLRTLAEHSSAEWCYDILILTKDIQSDSVDMLTNAIGDRENISLRFLDVNPYIQQYSLKVHSHFGIESYFRLLYPFILRNYQKVLYFDCDMVLKSDVADLWQEDIGDAFLGACIDAVVVGAVNNPEDKTFDSFGWNEYCRDKLRMENPYRYFNSGVMIFNLARFRREYSNEAVLRDAQENQYYLLDQDALNALAASDTIALDMAWNMTTDVGGRKMPYIKMATKSIQTAYSQARKVPHTVHFADSTKPWKNPNEDLGYEFWQVARQMPIYTQTVARMTSEQMSQITTVPIDNSPDCRPMGLLDEWKWRIKRWSAVVLPYGSKRRKIVKKWYFKLRGRSYTEEVA